ncbi:MAG: hypothetical protein KDA47_02130 [Planctomycetales bacterium]|nr:hypothetical protein [Planctomycetales bacterium]
MANEQQNQSNAATRPPAAKRSRLFRWLLMTALILTALLTVTGMLGGVILTAGVTHGEEFQPDTFHRRTYYYYRLPLFGFQLTPIYRDDHTGTLETKLSADKLIPAPARPPKDDEWDLIFEQSGATRRIQGDASILGTYLDMYADGDLVWLKWTNDHPKLAAVFWPAVAEVARHELYIWIPDLMNLPKGVGNPVELQTKLDAFMLENYQRFAREQFDRDRADLALELVEQGLKRAPNDAELLRLKSEAATKAKAKLPADSANS